MTLSTAFCVSADTIILYSSSDARSSRKIATMVDVFPVPGGPYMHVSEHDSEAWTALFRLAFRSSLGIYLGKPSRDDSQVVLESVDRPRNTVLTAWQRYGLHQASSCWLRTIRNCRASKNSPRRSMEEDGDSRSWRSLVRIPRFGHPLRKHVRSQN